MSDKIDSVIKQNKTKQSIVFEHAFIDYNINIERKMGISDQ
jgi:hypothetical protein